MIHFPFIQAFQPAEGYFSASKVSDGNKAKLRWEIRSIALLQRKIFNHQAMACFDDRQRHSITLQRNTPSAW